MKLSNYFLPIKKENPKDAEIISHSLMIKAGMCQQSSSGIYSWLPFGKQILDKIETITKNEMNLSGAIEILMPTIQSSELWKESGRYEDYGSEMLRIVDRNKRDFLYGPTNEELVTDIFRTHVKSYKELPLNLYHVQWKFRDELRPRFGVMRGREFLMKDAYSFDVSMNESIKSYNKMFVAYMQLFKKMGLNAVPMKADTGPIGGDLSHEFIIISKTGESEVYFDKRILEYNLSTTNINYEEDLQDIVNSFTSYYAATDEKHDKNFDNINIVKRKGIEVGHIFNFAQKYSVPMNASINNSLGENIHVYMGSYGVGISRLVGAIIESSHDDNGIIWPKEIAPYNIHLVNLNISNENCTTICSRVYSQLLKNDISVLFDDLDDSAGSKLAKADLLGLPVQIIIGPKGVKEDLLDVKIRKTNKTIKMNFNQIEDSIKSKKIKDLN